MKVFQEEIQAAVNHFRSVNGWLPEDPIKPRRILWHAEDDGWSERHKAMPERWAICQLVALEKLVALVRRT